MSELKTRLQGDLTVAIKTRADVVAATLRMALTAITNEEVAGKTARELSDADVVAVLGREAKKRREAAQAYDEANRPELADRERAELAVLAGYLPEQLSADAVAAIVAAAVEQVTATGASGGAAMGQVMRLVQPQVTGRADGAAVAAAVRTALGL